MHCQFTREDVNFYSKGTRCSAWLYLPEADKKCPVIVMAHGLGGTLLEFVKYSPGKFFGKIRTPIFVAACTKDDLAPADKTIELAKKAEKSVCKRYDCGHFQIYCNELFEEAVSDYIEFYNKIFA